MIQDCRENEKSFRNSFYYTNQIPLTIPELKTLICSDTTRYKMVYLYSDCCYGGNIVLNAMKNFTEQYDSTKINLYFVASGAAAAKYNETFFEKVLKITHPDRVYFIRDSTGVFGYNGNKFGKLDFSKVTNYLFINSKSHDATPQTYIVSKDNRIKMERAVFKYKNNKTEIDTIAYSLDYLQDYDFDKIDFSLIEEKTYIEGEK
jgi:hypothetical protein